MKDDVNVVVRKAFANELAWVNEQYASIHFVLSSDEDFIAVAEVSGIKAGIGRLTKVSKEAGELGGIFVLPEFRGHAIANRIVQFLLDNSLYSTLFCVPFAHLESFYKRFGFLSIAPTCSIPPEVAKKLNWCSAKYESDVIVMSRGLG